MKLQEGNRRLLSITLIIIAFGDLPCDKRSAGCSMSGDRKTRQTGELITTISKKQFINCDE
jgi:hypothetical protein